MSEELIESLKQTFIKLDKDRNGQLSKAEFRKFSSLMGTKIAGSDMDQLFAAVDGELGDKNGAISFEEFVTLATALFAME